MSAQYRLLWVHLHEKQFKCGDLVDEGVLVKAGYDLHGLVTAGEAELVSPAKTPKAKGK
jgi:hypothetical protein